MQLDGASMILTGYNTLGGWLLMLGGWLLMLVIFDRPKYCGGCQLGLAAKSRGPSGNVASGSNLHLSHVDEAENSGPGVERLYQAS